ncbi:hypothetical protein J6590_013833 [Homalodisca vitripennis]|nr:hypothetical protein J6590_013833 [Homalodisca vitripennis]
MFNDAPVRSKNALKRREVVEHDTGDCEWDRVATRPLDDTTGSPFTLCRLGSPTNPLPSRVICETVRFLILSQTKRKVSSAFFFTLPQRAGIQLIISGRTSNTKPVLRTIV